MTGFVVQGHILEFRRVLASYAADFYPAVKAALHHESVESE